MKGRVTHTYVGGFLDSVLAMAIYVLVGMDVRSLVALYLVDLSSPIVIILYHSSCSMSYASTVLLLATCRLSSVRTDLLFSRHGLDRFLDCVNPLPPSTSSQPTYHQVQQFVYCIINV